MVEIKTATTTATAVYITLESIFHPQDIKLHLHVECQSEEQEIRCPIAVDVYGMRSREFSLGNGVENSVVRFPTFEIEILKDIQLVK